MKPNPILTGKEKLKKKKSKFYIFKTPTQLPQTLAEVQFPACLPFMCTKSWQQVRLNGAN